MSSRQKAPGRKPRAMARGLRLAGVVLPLVAAVAAGHWTVGQLQRPDLMPLSRVVVDGELEHLRHDQLEAVVTLAVWGNYLTVDIEAVREAAESLPWVAAASVRRLWPDTLVIRVREREPFARWGDGALVNRRGEVFRPASLEGIDELPLLEGPDEKRGAEVVQRYVELHKTLAAAGVSLTRLRLDRRGGWHLWLNNEIEVALGGELLGQRLERVVFVLQLLGDELKQVARIDARYTSGMAVRWNDAAAAGSAAIGQVQG
jgi:cell division protein FtsQ